MFLSVNQALKLAALYNLIKNQYAIKTKDGSLNFNYILVSLPRNGFEIAFVYGCALQR